MARSGGGFALGKPATRLCPECGSRFTRTLLHFEFEGKPFGFFPADVCENEIGGFRTDQRGVDNRRVRRRDYSPHASRPPLSATRSFEKQKESPAQSYACPIAVRSMGED